MPSLDLILIVFLLTTILVAACRFGKSGVAIKIFMAILALSLITQSINALCRLYDIRQTVVYRTSNHIELVIFCLYFNYSIPRLRDKHVGWVFAAATFIIGVGLGLYSHPHSIGSPFLIFEGAIVIGFSIYSIYKQLTESSKERAFGNIHFWLSVCVGFLWCTTLLSLGMYDYFRAQNHPVLRHLKNIIWTADFMSLWGMLLVFSLLPAPSARLQTRRILPIEIGGVV